MGKLLQLEAKSPPQQLVGRQNQPTPKIKILLSLKLKSLKPKPITEASQM